MSYFHQMRCDRDQPGYYSDMLKAIAEIENTVTEKRVTYPNIDAARKAKVKFTEMIFCINHNEIRCIKVEMIGNIKSLIFGLFALPVSQYTKPVSMVVSKSLKDYKTKPRKAGGYKHCEGGGWYSMANLYELNGKFYTDAY